MGCFGDPQRPEKTRFRVRGSSKIKVFVFGQRTAKQSPNRPQNEPKINLKTAPRGPKCRSEALLDFRLNFSTDVEPIWNPKRLHAMGRKVANIAQKLSSAPQGRPKASRDPPGGLQGAILASFWAPGSSFSSLSSVLFEACARPTTRSKTLFEITSQRILCDRCGTDAHNTAGSVVGLGPQAHWRSGH